MTHSLKELVLLAVPGQGIFSLTIRAHGKVNHFQDMVGWQPQWPRTHWEGSLGVWPSHPCCRGACGGVESPTCQVECGQTSVSQDRDVFHLDVAAGNGCLSQET